MNETTYLLGLRGLHNHHHYKFTEKLITINEKSKITLIQYEGSILEIPTL